VPTISGRANGIGAVLISMLWNDDSGEISEYALILALILMLGIALISQTGTTLKRLYQRVSSQQSTSATTVLKKK
jgi:Flp pilus assembly pilin Flp